MTENSPPPAARTSGQAALWRVAATAFYAADGHPLDSEDLDGFSDDMRTRWEAAAQAAIAADSYEPNSLVAGPGEHDVVVIPAAGPENSWAEAFHDDAAEARAGVLRLRERVTELEAANAALVLARPDANQALEIPGMRSALREICNAMQQHDDGRASAVEAIDMIDATLSDHGAKP